MKDPKKVAMGKKSRAAGMRFEKKVRLDLEKKKWIVNRWMNNVELEFTMTGEGKKLINLTPGADHKLIPAKGGRFRSTTTGFPDFMVFREIKVANTIEMHSFETEEERKKNLRGGKKIKFERVYEIRGIECKSNGYLDKEEKEKCDWYLDNQIFSKILIASKDKFKRGVIVYKEYDTKK